MPTIPMVGAGTLALAAAEARALLLDITTGWAFKEDAGRSLEVYSDAGRTTLVGSYPRVIGPPGADVLSYRADGLAPLTAYWLTCVWSHSSGETASVDLDNQSTIAETGGSVAALADPVLVIDARDPGVAFPLELPSQPSITQIAQAVSSSSALQRDIVPAAGAPYGSAGGLNVPPAVIPWVIVDAGGSGGGFDAAQWLRFPGSSLVCMYVNTTGNLASGDGVYYTEPVAVDLSGDGIVTISIYSGGGEHRVGTFLDLVLSQDAITWTQFPFTIGAANTWQTIQINISAMVPRNAVLYWGIEAKDATPFTIYWREIKTGTGLLQSRDYVVVTRRTWTAGADTLLALDSEPSTIATATKPSVPSINTLTCPLPDTDCELLVYGRDTLIGDTAFHYLGIATLATTATYADSLLDCSQNLTLVEGKSQAPHAVDAIGRKDNRLALAKGSDLWLSSSLSLGDWFDVTPGEAPDVALPEYAGCRLPLAEVGKIVGIATHGVASGSDLIGDTVLLTRTEAIRLSGSSWHDFNAGFRQPGGCAGPHAWCGLPDGRLVTVTPEGAVIGYGRGLDVSDPPISDAIREALREADTAGREGWLLGVDPERKRLLLSTSDVVYALDLATGGWSTADLPSLRSLGTYPAGYGAHLSAGTEDGRVLRVWDPEEASQGWEWRSAELNAALMGRAPGSQVQPCLLEMSHDGTVTVTLYADGVAVWTGPAYRKLHFGPGQMGWTIGVKFEGAAGSKVRGAALTLGIRG